MEFPSNKSRHSPVFINKEKSSKNDPIWSEIWSFLCGAILPWLQGALAPIKTKSSTSRSPSQIQMQIWELQTIAYNQHNNNLYSVRIRIPTRRDRLHVYFPPISNFDTSDYEPTRYAMPFTAISPFQNQHTPPHQSQASKLLYLGQVQERITLPSYSLDLPCHLERFA